MLPCQFQPQGYEHSHVPTERRGSVSFSSQWVALVISQTLLPPNLCMGPMPGTPFLVTLVLSIAADLFLSLDPSGALSDPPGCSRCPQASEFSKEP